MARDYSRPIYEKQRRVTIENVLIAWEYRCAHCNRVFRSKRRDAKYCPESSGRFCRTQARREAHRDRRK